MLSEKAWSRLIQAQNKIESQEEEILIKQEETLAKLLCLQKQKKLLRKHAGEFLQKDLKEIEDLERLEEEEDRKKTALIEQKKVVETNLVSSSIIPHEGCPLLVAPNQPTADVSSFSLSNSQQADLDTWIASSLLMLPEHS
jgi:hypothetical protein